MDVASPQIALHGDDILLHGDEKMYLRLGNRAAQTYHLCMNEENKTPTCFKLLARHHKSWYCMSNKGRLTVQGVSDRAS